MERDTKADAEVVLRSVRKIKIFEYLVAEPDRIVIELDDPKIDILAKFYVDSAAEHHSKVV